MAFWQDEPVLLQTQTIQEAQAGFSTSRLTSARNVATALVLKEDQNVTRGPYKYNQINHSKLLKPILQSDKISDGEKYKLCKNGASQDAKDWMARLVRAWFKKILVRAWFKNKLQWQLTLSYLCCMIHSNASTIY